MPYAACRHASVAAADIAAAFPGCHYACCFHGVYCLRLLLAHDADAATLFDTLRRFARHCRRRRFAHAATPRRHAISIRHLTLISFRYAADAAACQMPLFAFSLMRCCFFRFADKRFSHATLLSAMLRCAAAMSPSCRCHCRIFQLLPPS